MLQQYVAFERRSKCCVSLDTLRQKSQNFFAKWLRGGTKPMKTTKPTVTTNHTNKNKPFKGLVTYLISAAILYAIGYWLHVVQNLVTGMIAAWHLGWYPVAVGCGLLLASPFLSAVYLWLKNEASKKTGL
jgi:hypothetical protein